MNHSLRPMTRARRASTNRGPPRSPPPPPPIAVPAVENWRRAQAMRTIGLLSLGCGGVLVVLGIVRIAFSAIEQFL